VTRFREDGKGRKEKGVPTEDENKKKKWGIPN
jgi:hypothetical protein